MADRAVQFLSWAISLAAVVLQSSCSDDKIEVYRIPKETRNVAMEEASSTSSAPARAARWTRPDAWSEQPLSEMRLGSFKVDGPDKSSADVSITAFPGDAGGLVSNINRWRGQLELPPMGEQELQKTIQRTEIQGGPVYFVDLQSTGNSPKSSRILGAVLERPDRTWFVKMTGPPALLENQRQKFFDFVNSFRFDSAEQSEVSAAPPKQKSTNDK
jgi:hypothetical protein